LPKPLVSPNPSILFAQQKSIITRMTVAQSSSYQFLHTLGGDIYIYVFGERIGTMSISGLSFAKSCAPGDDGQHGLEKMLKWYKQYRLSARPTPVNILIGSSTTLQAFVSDITGDVVDPSLFLVQWTMNLMVIPDK